MREQETHLFFAEVQNKLLYATTGHTAAEHPWFQESRASRDNARADWYVWADARPDGSPPNNWQSWMGGPAWRGEPRRRQYHLHNFLPQMPDLNFHCAAVQEAMLDIARHWLDRGVDGFRLDTANLYFHSRGLQDNPPLPAGQRGDAPVLMREVHAQDENVTVTGIFDDHPVDYSSEAAWRAHVELMEQAGDDAVAQVLARYATQRPGMPMPQRPLTDYRPTERIPVHESE